MTRKFASWRFVLLLPAALLFAFGGYELFQHLAFLEHAEQAVRPLPKTMYGEHSGLAIAAFALGLAFGVGAFRRRRCI